MSLRSTPETGMRSLGSGRRWQRWFARRLESRSEVTQRRRLPHDVETLDVGAPRIDVGHDLDDVVDVALRVNAARNRKAHEFHRCECFLTRLRIRLAEHHAADLDRAN